MAALLGCLFRQKEVENCGRDGADLAESESGTGAKVGGDSAVGPDVCYDVENCRLEDLARSPHDPARWRQDFESAGDGKKNPNMFRIRALRQLIWLQTEKEFIRLEKEEPQKLGQGDTIPFEVGDCLQADGQGQDQEEPQNTKVEVMECDMLEKAGDFVKQGCAVAVLNMASSSSPGGGFRFGAGAQEENLYRRSDLYRFLEPCKGSLYPIKPDACLLSTNVTILRGSEKEGYPFLVPSFEAAIITCAALRYPALTTDRKYKYAEDEESMRQKVRVILKGAEKAGCDACVLSAFGCGAFGNPPEEVARLFHEEIATVKLQKVCFCIFNDHNAGRAHNPRGNYLPFKKAFEDDVGNVSGCCVG